MRKRLMLALVAPLALMACAGKGPLQRSEPAEACSELVMPMKPRVSKLPTGGAIMVSATLIAASAPQPAASGATPASGTPEHCEVVGRIVAADKTAPPIRFQVNMPTQWNGRAVQYGDPHGDPAPLALGYATYTQDETPADASYDAHKKLRDVAALLMIRGYGRGPQKVYFIGSSEGGRDGLALAQHFPQDFDGIVNGVRAPASPTPDATSPDLKGFQVRGGKLLMLDGASDAAPAPTAGARYYDSAVAQYGQAKVDQFMRLYGGTPANVDLLVMVAAWVEHDQAPAVQRCAPTLPAKEPPCP